MHTLRYAIIAPMICLMAVSCMAATGVPDSLAGSRWILAELPPDELLERAIATLGFEDDRVVGSDGCNRFHGPFTFQDDELRIGKLVSTRKACPEPVMRQAKAYTTALSRARGARVEDESLVLLDVNGELLARFDPQPTTLANTQWKVTGYNNGKQAVVSTERDSVLTLEFDAGGAVHGTAGCNNFRGNYSAGAAELTIGEIASTRRMCEEHIMAQESAYLEALRRSATWRAEANRLEVRDAGHALLVIATLAESGSSENWRHTTNSSRIPLMRLLLSLPFWAFLLVTAAIIYAALEAGHAAGLRHRRSAGATKDELGSMLAAMLGLLGFILAIPFGTQLSRFDKGKTLLLEEANAIHGG